MKNLQLLPLDEEPEKARLIQPAGSGYVLLAAEVDAHPSFLWASRTKRLLIEDCTRWCARIAQQPGVLDAATFQAILLPPIGEPGSCAGGASSSTVRASTSWC